MHYMHFFIHTPTSRVQARLLLPSTVHPKPLFPSATAYPVSLGKFSKYEYMQLSNGRKKMPQNEEKSCLETASNSIHYHIVETNVFLKLVLTVRCWNSHALKILVATLGKMPRFFWFFLPFDSSSSSPVPSPLPTLALLASPVSKFEFIFNRLLDCLLTNIIILQITDTCDFLYMAHGYFENIRKYCQNISKKYK